LHGRGLEGRFFAGTTLIVPVQARRDTGHSYDDDDEAGNISSSSSGQSEADDDDEDDDDGGVSDRSDDDDDDKSERDPSDDGDDSDDEVSVMRSLNDAGESIPLTPRGRYARRGRKGKEKVGGGAPQRRRFSHHHAAGPVGSRRSSLAAVVGVTTMLRRMSLTATTLGRRARDEMRAAVGSAASSPRAYSDDIRLSKPATTTTLTSLSGSTDHVRRSSSVASGLGGTGIVAGADTVASLPSAEENFLTSANLCRWVINFQDLHIGNQVRSHSHTLSPLSPLFTNPRACRVP
jgi:hypothetical protein